MATWHAITHMYTCILVLLKHYMISLASPLFCVFMILSLLVVKSRAALELAKDDSRLLLFGD